MLARRLQTISGLFLCCDERRHLHGRRDGRNGNTHRARTGRRNAPDGTNTTPAENTPETSHSASGEATETPEPIPFFYITDEERTLIEEVVAAESRGEPHDGQVAVAECILNACLKDDIRPAEAIERYKYTKARATPTYSVQLAVAEVFDEGKLITDEPILYFYNPAYGTSEFHESQTFVLEIENHRFFKEAKA